MAHQSDTTMRHMASQTNVVANWPVTLPAIADAHLIFGPDRASIRGSNSKMETSSSSTGVDMEFDKLVEHVSDVIVNTMAACNTHWQDRTLHSYH